LVEPDEDFEKSDSYVQHTAGPSSVEPDGDYGASNVDNTDQGESVDFEGEEVLYSNTQTHFAMREFENVSNGTFDTEEWSSKRRRPTRATRRPTRFRDSEFETQFRPGKKKGCNKLGRGDEAGSHVDNFCNFHNTQERRCAAVLVGENNRESSEESTYR